MESLFQADFGEVRSHIRTAPAKRGAIAYAHGNDLCFLPGYYAPETRFGRFVLGHELAHVMQQRQGRTSALARDRSGAAANCLEWEADLVGACVALDLPVGALFQRAPSVIPSSPMAVVQCLKFKYLTARGKAYKGEEAGVAMRQLLLTPLEVLLRAAWVDYVAANGRRPRLALPGQRQLPTPPDVALAIARAVPRSIGSHNGWSGRMLC